MGIISPVGTGAWLRQSGTIAASGTSIVHELPENSARAIKYVFAFYNVAENKTKSFEFHLNKEGGNIKTTVINKLGKQIRLSINADINSGQIEVEVINNELFELNYEFGYLTLGRG